MSETVPGGGGNNGGEYSGGGSGSNGIAAPSPTEIPRSYETNEWCSEALTPCREPDDPAEPTASIEDITLSDLASFRPSVPTLTGEPLGFALVGAPTNVLGSATADQFGATLLGLNVTVRFEPDEYVFTYGDGSGAAYPSGGESWTALRLPQFTPTDTSHIYTQPGEYTASLTVNYAPYVTLDPQAGWLRVPGYITASAGSYPVRAVEARTALVDQTCEQNPSAAGC
ncbi:hypothetical protein [Microbacterium sp. C7(2022)]|uniref:hypothetical protein n=1 Tax=Microbacterium sp. C7(2022) TaxID=2992759 RepID=UPI00237C4F86|nr:hypothetical protein [Microbacterium sp. C7(2022)]MDE0546785.1 hypothetical protein [Microbacterium sp. C7(2022)]